MIILADYALLSSVPFTMSTISPGPKSLSQPHISPGSRTKKKQAKIANAAARRDALELRIATKEKQAIHSRQKASSQVKPSTQKVTKNVEYQPLISDEEQEDLPLASEIIAPILKSSLGKGKGKEAIGQARAIDVDSPSSSSAEGSSTTSKKRGRAADLDEENWILDSS